MIATRLQRSVDAAWPVVEASFKKGREKRKCLETLKKAFITRDLPPTADQVAVLGEWKETVNPPLGTPNRWFDPGETKGLREFEASETSSRAELDKAAAESKEAGSPTKASLREKVQEMAKLVAEQQIEYALATALPTECAAADSWEEVVKRAQNKLGGGALTILVDETAIEPDKKNDPLFWDCTFVKLPSARLQGKAAIFQTESKIGEWYTALDFELGWAPADDKARLSSLSRLLICPAEPEIIYLSMVNTV